MFAKIILMNYTCPYVLIVDRMKIWVAINYYVDTKCGFIICIMGITMHVYNFGLCMYIVMDQYNHK